MPHTTAIPPKHHGGGIRLQTAQHRPKEMPPTFSCKTQAVPGDMLGLRAAGSGEPQVAPQLPVAPSRGFKEENNPKFQSHAWIYKHMDSLWAVADLLCS